MKNCAPKTFLTIYLLNQYINKIKEIKQSGKNKILLIDEAEMWK